MLETLKRLFQRGQAPQPVISDHTFGVLTWSADDESWAGSFRGRSFLLAYDGSSMPSEAVRAYALRLLDDATWLERTLASAKGVAQRKYSSFYSSEIESLELGVLHFSIHRQRGEYMLADLDGGKDDRLWRIEYSGNTCVGIGFDT